MYSLFYAAELSEFYYAILCAARNLRAKVHKIFDICKFIFFSLVNLVAACN